MRARVLCVRTTLGAGVGALSVRRVPRTLAACLTPLVNVFARAFAVLAAVGISLQVVLHGFIHVGGARRKVFNKEWAEAAKASGLVEEHKKATGQAKLPQGAYPDMGHGRFSALLPYASWLRFNNAQRAHHQNLEMLPSVLVCLLVAGLFSPVEAAYLGVGYLVSRELYAWGYVLRGSSGRMLGALGADLVFFALVFYAVKGALAVAKLY